MKKLQYRRSVLRYQSTPISEILRYRSFFFNIGSIPNNTSIPTTTISKFKFIYRYRRILDIKGQIIYQYRIISFDIEGSRPSISKFSLILLGPPGSPGSCRVADRNCWLEFSAWHILQCNYFIAGECLSVGVRPAFSRPRGGARGGSRSRSCSRSRRDASNAHAAWNLPLLCSSWWVLVVPLCQKLCQKTMELVVRYVSVLLEGRVEVLVDVGGDSRVVSTIVRAESHERLQVGQELLGEMVDDRSIMECPRVGEILSLSG
jgi:hypothetical protein